MTTLIVGCGYLGRRVGRLLRDRGNDVHGTTRSAANAGVLRTWGVSPVVADVLDPSTLTSLPTADRVLFCVGYDRSTGVPPRAVYVNGLRNVLNRLGEQSTRWVLVSSTGVYGQVDGSWVDESSPTHPLTETGRACFEAEELFQDSSLGGAIVRYSGLYGPGRIIRRTALERGEVITADPDKWLNLIHIDDAAAVAVALLERQDVEGIVVASDDRPVYRREYYMRAAELLKVSPPRFAPPTPGSPAAREESNKRVSNRRLRVQLAIPLIYPDITTGLPATVAAELQAD
jgi:nucleoside-diphosphate-sugar epimerase